MVTIFTYSTAVPPYTCISITKSSPVSSTIVAKAILGLINAIAMSLILLLVFPVKCQCREVKYVIPPAYLLLYAERALCCSPAEDMTSILDELERVSEILL